MKCDALLSNKVRCRNKGKKYSMKIEVEGEIITREVSFCEVHLKLQQLIQELKK